MEDISTLTNQLQDYANSLDCGYLKTWKAAGMVRTLHAIPGIGQDNIRLLNYLTSCLEMEGFGGYEIEHIQRWVIENIL